MIPSCAMACRSLGAPVRLCSPAPQHEKKEPITITHGEGHARVPTTGLPFTERPNLFRHEFHMNAKQCSMFFLTISNENNTYLSLNNTPSMQAPNKSTQEISKRGS